ncbi:MAG: carbohydrate ABC transporter permease [Lachnospiraceae bacterium]|jgi:putative aldouronate transport system permease protein|nr:carbohydrate ABC transporter permease [Lachnospiraceae bacterium]
MITRNKPFIAFMYVLMALLTIACLFPFLLLFMSSITSEATLAVNGYSLLPEEFSLDAYRFLWTTRKNLLHSLGISVFVTTVGVIANVTLTTLFAYPLSRKDLPGRNAISLFLFFTMLFNGGMVPTYMVYANYLHIKNTIWALIVPYLLMNAFYIITMRTYINSNIADEVIEAAKIDGASEVQILTRIVLPLSRPIIATIALLAMIGYWNNWTNGVYFLSSDELYGIQNFLNEVISNAVFLASKTSGSTMTVQIPTVAVRMAIAVVAVLPVLIAYPFFQKSFVKGITLGSVKG